MPKATQNCIQTNNSQTHQDSISKDINMPHDDVKTLQENLMNKNRENKEKEIQLSKNREELEKLQRQINLRSEEKQDDETYLQSAQRRLKLYQPDDTKNALKIITKITEDVMPLIPATIKESLANMRGNKWTTGTRQICLEYNLDNCTMNFSHFNKGDRCFKLHLCIFCIKFFEIGMYHACHGCPTLSIIGENVMQVNQN